MEMRLNLPEVSDCSVNDCAYNVNERCHARAITIGDGVHPSCDTFLGATKHVRNSRQIAGVGACKVRECINNEDLECIATQIKIGHRAGEINCLTFNPS